MDLPIPRFGRNTLPPITPSVPQGKDYHCYLWCSWNEDDCHTADSYLEKLENKGYKCACFKRDVPPNCPEVSGFNNIIRKCHWFVIFLPCMRMRREEVYGLNVILKYVEASGKDSVIVLLLDMGLKDILPPALLPFKTIDTSRVTWVDQVGQLIRQAPQNMTLSARNALQPIIPCDGSQPKYITYSGDTRDHPINGIIPKAKYNDFQLFMRREQIEDKRLKVKEVNEQLERVNYESTTTPSPEGLVTLNKKTEEKTEIASSQSHVTPTDASTQQRR